jgi:hypothetical protein
MMVGGDKITGIHGAHFAPGISIRYAAEDGARQRIPWVEYRNENTGETRAFSNSGPAQDSSKGLPKYEMQCVDCHNRPTHTFELPERAMDKALAAGDIPVTLPYVKKKSVELLKTGYGTSEEAAAKLPGALVRFIRSYPQIYAQRTQDIERAGKPSLRSTTATSSGSEGHVGYLSNNLGHTDFPGCFRCHDGSHTAVDGKSISQDCNLSRAVSDGRSVTRDSENSGSRADLEVQKQ